MQELKRQLHISGINMFTRCGEQFRRRYIEHEILPPGVSIIIGSATDRSVSDNLQKKLDTDLKEMLPIDVVGDIARDQAVHSFEGREVWFSKEEIGIGLKKVVGSAIDDAVKLSKLHYTDFAPHINPTHVQREWVLSLDGYPYDLAGTIDVQEGNKAIRDTKTSGKTPVSTIADTSDQLTIYSLASYIIDGELPEEVVLDYLIRNKVPIARSFRSKRTKTDFDYILNRIQVVIEAIEKGVFIPANRDHWICTPKFCGYYEDCPYSRKPVSVTV